MCHLYNSEYYGSFVAGENIGDIEWKILQLTVGLLQICTMKIINLLFPQALYNEGSQYTWKTWFIRY